MPASAYVTLLILSEPFFVTKADVSAKLPTDTEPRPTELCFTRALPFAHRM